MAKVKIYNLEGQSIGEQELADDLFKVQASPALLQQAVITQRNNSRQVAAHTKTKGEVRGGGAKPWQQKGTGRARAGSNRSPLWAGGGVTFGPRKNRNFEQKINQTMKRRALAAVLSDKVKNDRLILVDQLELAEGKSKNLAALLEKLPIKKNSVLISLAEKKENIYRAAKNLAKVGLLAANSLNVVDLLKKDYLLLDQAALAKISEFYKK